MLPYLHIGNGVAIRQKDIIGIFDGDTATVSEVTKEYLSQKEAEKAVTFAVMEIPKSFVLYRDGGKYKIAFSQLAVKSLLGRA